jgi:alpha-beta hydrolase superfamily lysophospholipase
MPRYNRADLAQCHTLTHLRTHLSNKEISEMKDSQYSWVAKDGKTIFARTWTDHTAVKANILLVHGLGEHSGRYEHMADFYTQEGYAVTSFDLPGHGKSTGKRGSASYDEIVEDIDYSLAQLRKESPDKPLFLFGHSLGGALVLYYVLKKKPTLSGVISQAPSLAAGYPIPGWKQLLAQVMSTLYPGMTMENGLDRGQLSRDPEIEKQYSADPLVHPLISARLGWDLLEKGKAMQGEAECFPQLPYLIQVSSVDQLTDPKATIRFAENMRGNITLKVWEGFYHELHNEPEKKEVFAYTLNWLDQHLA